MPPVPAVPKPRPEPDPACEAIINRVIDHIEDRIRYLMASREISYESASRIIMREIERGD